MRLNIPIEEHISRDEGRNGKYAYAPSGVNGKDLLR